MAMGLQARNNNLKSEKKLGNSAARTQIVKQHAEVERQKSQARQWEEARIQREQRDKKLRLEEHKRNSVGCKENNALHLIIEKVFKKYWDMEFPNLGGTNPFRIVIDRESAFLIAPDYFNIIATPMNLTYIKDKVKGRNYTTLTQFFTDIDLMIDNALKYNVGEDNPYRIASDELKKKHTKIVKGVWKQIKEKQNQQNRS